jgi:tetratricopeptide (TPR) repeat protein
MTMEMSRDAAFTAYGAYTASGQWEQAEALAAARLRDEGESEEWLSRHALSCMAQGRFAEALQSLDRAACVNPASPEALLAGCVVLADLGFYDEAAKRDEAARALSREEGAVVGSVTRNASSPGWSSIPASRSLPGATVALELAHRELALTYLDAHDAARAQEQIERALELRETPDGRRILARVHVRQGDPARALVELERARQSAPHDPSAHVDAALCYVALGRENEARDALVRAETLGDASRTGAVLRRALLAPEGH